MTDAPVSVAADNDEDDNYLMQAWQAMGRALAAAEDDDDKSGMLQVMDLIKSLLAADGTGQSLPTHTAFASRLPMCPLDNRQFVFGDALAAHLKQVHGKSAKE